MRTAFCVGAGRLEVREEVRPVPGSGETLIRVRQCGVCGSDLHWFGGSFPAPEVCPGHEIAGEVAEPGAANDRFEVGDRVVVEPLVVCRECPSCRTGDYQLCPHLQLLGLSAPGGFAEYVSVPGYAVYPLAPGLSFEIGALAEPTAVCVHAARLARIRCGQRVLVLGAGTIGLLSVLAAGAAGAAEVVVTARYEHQARMARVFGATQVFRTTSEGRENLAAFCRAQPVDTVIETVGGSADTLDQALQLVRPGGTVAVLGIFTERPAWDGLTLVVKEVHVIGALTYGRAGRRADFEIALELLSVNSVPVAELVTHRFPLTEIQQAFEVARARKLGAIKVSVAP